MRLKWKTAMPGTGRNPSDLCQLAMDEIRDEGQWPLGVSVLGRRQPGPCRLN